MAQDILRNNPTLDVNWQDKDGLTALHRACASADHSTVSLLLAHPDIDVSLRNLGGETVFLTACGGLPVDCMRTLLHDARIELAVPDLQGWLPLSYATRFGRIENVKWWIASGREVGELPAGLKVSNSIVALLENFKENPVETIAAVRLELGITGERTSSSSAERRQSA